MVGEVPGDVGDEAQLGQLCRLELEGGEARVEEDPEPGPVHRQPAQGKPPVGGQVGEEDQHQRDEQGDVAIPAQYRDRASVEQQQRQSGQAGCDQDPPPLRACPNRCCGEIEPIDLEEAKGGEGCHRGEEQGSGLRGEGSHSHMKPAKGDQEDEEGQGGLGVDRPFLSEVDQGHGERRQYGGRHDQRALGVAGHGLRRRRR